VERSGVRGADVDVGGNEVPACAPLSLWWASIDLPDAALRDLAGCLSPEERRRADDIGDPLARDRFVAARGWLRRLLAPQLQCLPHEVEIVTGDHGKPKLESSDLCFSVSRSAGYALYATSWKGEIGVDVEMICPMPDMEGIATRFFSRSEQLTLASLPPAQRLTGFYQCWTRKEAFVKGIGTRLGFPSSTVDVWADGAQPAMVSGWSVYQVDVAPEFAAAIACSYPGHLLPATRQRVVAPTSMRWATD
jgi:4'-phosphopantetheinyl transferase